LRVCANDDCRWAFEDTSRAGRRRWCDMTTCGNVAKARRYRARKKLVAEADPAAAETPEDESAGVPTAARA
jgi:predicted RNA-binding Zn ribbon-like protein